MIRFLKRWRARHRAALELLVVLADMKAAEERNMEAAGKKGIEWCAERDAANGNTITSEASLGAYENQRDAAAAKAKRLEQLAAKVRR